MDELLALEHAGWASLCEGTGSDFYARTMAEDGVMVMASGQVMTRPEVLSVMKEAPPWVSYEIDDVRFVRLPDDAAALVYVGSARRAGDDVPFVAAMSSVYARRAGAWELVLYQQTSRS